MKMNNTRFMVRETKSGLEKLDWALNIMGYSSRADWYREKKREINLAGKGNDCGWVWQDCSSGL